MTSGITDDVRGGHRGPGGHQEGIEAVQEPQTLRGSQEVRGELFVQRGGGLRHLQGDRLYVEEGQVIVNCDLVRCVNPESYQELKTTGMRDPNV